MLNKTIGGILISSMVFVFFFSFSIPDISRVSILALKKPGPSRPGGPHFTPGPWGPLGPSPNTEFSHPHMTPGPNEPLGPNPPGLTPPHCPPGPNEPLEPHNLFGGQTSLRLRILNFNHFEGGCAEFPPDEETPS